jgi:hypothetical protein
MLTNLALEYLESQQRDEEDGNVDGLLAGSLQTVAEVWGMPYELTFFQDGSAIMSTSPYENEGPQNREPMRAFTAMDVVIALTEYAKKLDRKAA